MKEKLNREHRPELIRLREMTIGRLKRVLHND